MWPPSRHHVPSLEPRTTIPSIAITDLISFAPSVQRSELNILSLLIEDLGICMNIDRSIRCSPPAVPIHTPVTSSRSPLSRIGPAGSKTLTTADLDSFNRSAILTNVSASSISKTHHGSPADVIPSVVFHAISPELVATISRGPLPCIGTWIASLADTSESERASVNGELRISCPTLTDLPPLQQSPPEPSSDTLTVHAF